MTSKRKRYPRISFLMMKDYDELITMFECLQNHIEHNHESENSQKMIDLILNELEYRCDDGPPRRH